MITPPTRPFDIAIAIQLSIIGTCSRSWRMAFRPSAISVRTLSRSSGGAGGGSGDLMRQMAAAENRYVAASISIAPGAVNACTIQPADANESGLGDGGAGRELAVALDQLLLLDQRRQVRLVGDIEERGQDADDEGHDVELHDVQATEQRHDRHGGDDGGAQQVGRDHDRAAAQAVDPDAGDEAEGDAGDDVGDGEQRDLPARCFEEDDGRKGQRKTARERAEYRNRLSCPKEAEVAVLPEALAPELHRGSLVLSTEPRRFRRIYTPGVEPQVSFVRTKDGTSIAYYDVGDGLPVVWMDMPYSHLQYEWRQDQSGDGLLALVASQARLIRYDHRGFGLSDRECTDCSFDGYVQDLETVVERCGVTSFVLLATRGPTTPIAIEYAVRHPDRVAALIIFNAAASAPELMVKQIRDMLSLADNDWRFASEGVSRLVLGWDDEVTSRSLAELLRASTDFEGFYRGSRVREVGCAAPAAEGADARAAHEHARPRLVRRGPGPRDGGGYA